MHSRSSTRGWTINVSFASLGLILHALDLLTGIHGMETYGLAFEQNPLARFLFATYGPAGLTAAKLGTVIAATYVFVRMTRRGQVRVAGSGLVACALLGLLGVISNVGL
jgi:hypothetical protein